MNAAKKEKRQKQTTENYICGWHRFSGFPGGAHSSAMEQEVARVVQVVNDSLAPMGDLSGNSISYCSFPNATKSTR